MASESSQDPFDLHHPTGSPLASSLSHHKSWEDLHLAVRKTRKLATAMMSRVPHTFTFRHVETADGTQTRLYFLGVLPGSRENILLHANVPQEKDLQDQPLEWLPLLDAFQATPIHGQFSKEEQLLRERKRLGSLGITSYEFDDKSAKFVFPACNSLFYCKDTLVDGKLSSQTTSVHEATTSCQNARLDPKMCPTNSNLLACVSGNDIWVTNLQSGHEKRLTHAHKGLPNLANDPVSAGLPSFVVQEEFDRYTGYWWQPAVVRDPGDQVVYRILYEEVDESEVEILHIVSQTNDDKGVDDYRYPRAGTTNARCTLKMLEFQVNEVGDIYNVEEKSLVEPLTTLFPWMEYVTRAGWTPDGTSVYIQMIDRRQQKEQIVLIPAYCFSVNPGADVEMQSLESVLSVPFHVLYENTSDVWINVSDILHFFPQEKPDEISFLTSSEKSGYSHLYYVTSSLTQSVISSNDGAFDMNDKQNGEMQSSCIIREVPVTKGDWEVITNKIWVDEDRKLVYFMALKDSPLELHLYVTSYTNPGPVIRLTEKGRYHVVQLDKECSMFVTVSSSIDEAPSSQLYRIMHISSPPSITTQYVGYMHQPTTIAEDYRPPVLFNYKNSSEDTMYGMYYKPHHHEEGQKYPTVLFVYGGPKVQLVTNSYKGMRFLRLHTLASLGYAVVTIDNRGSFHRGLHFESHLKDRLGMVEISDQVEGLQWLASQVDFIDLNKVAIHGWSYGGYLSLMGLAQQPEIFKVAIAGAPVTSWKLYDTGYTERYMGTPDDNPDGYKSGSVLEYVSKFPSEGNRLLIVHGLIDENVHFFHTSLLINALIKACKPYQLQVYPNERHGIRNPEASEHYETMVLDFLQKNL